MKTGRKKSILGLWALLCILSGCAPRERTMLLPQVEINVEEEGIAATEDYTVKKIYTYEYKSWAALERSAFFGECGKYEIRAIEEETRDGREVVVGQRVDYRYGFHDEEGVYFWPWENWSEGWEGEMQGDLYVEKVVPSPNGKQLLVYLKSAFEDTCFVWLCEAGSEEPWMLCGGEMEEGGTELLGAFSPGGRWFTFDTLGKMTGRSGFVLVYDTQEEAQPEAREKFRQEIEKEGGRALENGEDPAMSFYPPARRLPVLGTEMSFPLAGNIFTVSGNLGLLNLGHVNENQLWVRYEYLEETAEEDAEPLRTEVQFFLDWEMGTHYPYPRYSLDAEKHTMYYLKNFQELVEVDLETGESTGVLWDFPDHVLDFKLLDSGDLLVLSTQDDIVIDEKKETNANSQAWMDGFDLQEIQARSGIRSVDLYLYPRGETAGKLLYKGVQDLLHMECDEETRRILLETYVDGDMGLRKCIVLEL